MNNLLEKLNISPINAGACTGVDGWLMDSNGKELISYNPTSGEPIAKIIQATPETYEKVASTASARSVVLPLKSVSCLANIS